jgi:hypothetical protein
MQFTWGTILSSMVLHAKHILQVEFHQHISCQFSIALDIYLQIRRVVALLITESLRRDSPDWYLKHACPACTYTLTDEEKLHFKILYAMDGNDSLK